MVQRGNSYHLRIQRYPFWAADIGMAASDADPYLAYLEALPTRERCLFAVSPDAYLEFAGLIRDLGFAAAIVAQDHAERLVWPWDEFDCLFIGGERKADAKAEWKLSAGAQRLCREARSRGKWVHMGRVNTFRRMQRAREMGCCSADGTYVKYARRLREREAGDFRESRGAVDLAAWRKWLADNPILWDFEAPALPVHREALR